MELRRQKAEAELKKKRAEQEKENQRLLEEKKRPEHRRLIQAFYFPIFLNWGNQKFQYFDIKSDKKSGNSKNQKKSEPKSENNVWTDFPGIHLFPQHTPVLWGKKEQEEARIAEMKRRAEEFKRKEAERRQTSAKCDGIFDTISRWGRTEIWSKSWVEEEGRSHRRVLWISISIL